MAYSDNDVAASAAAAGESKFIQSPKNPLYTVKVKIEEEYEIDNCINRNKNGHIISENYGERAVEVEFTSKEPKLAKLKIRLTPSEKKMKKKKKRKTKKEVETNVTEDMPVDENHEYGVELIDNTVQSESDINEEYFEPEITLEDIIKMEAEDLDFSPEENIDPQMFMDTLYETPSKKKHKKKKNGKTKKDDFLGFPCDQCEYVATRAGNLKQHKAAKHLGVRYPCDLCDHVSTQLGNLKQHKAVMHGCESRYTYNHYEYVATDRPDLTKHKGEKHKESIINDDEEPIFPCDQCEYVATQMGNLKTHKESIHQGIKYPCDQCDYVASQLGNLKQHKERKHEGIRYPCDQCSHLSTSKGHLKKHIEAVHMGIEYSCDKCDLTFKSVKALRLHREAKHEGITYPCLSCEYIASTKALLKKHTQSRHDGITYSCNLCTYTTTRNEYLKRHKKIKHTDQDWETKPPLPDSTPRYPPVVQNPFLVPTTDPMFLHLAGGPKAVSDTPHSQAET